MEREGARPGFLAKSDDDSCHLNVSEKNYQLLLAKYLQLELKAVITA